MGCCENSSEKTSSGCCGSSAATGDDVYCESQMVGQCISYAQAAKRDGKKVVGIMCEFAPREIILAAGALPACLCGGSQDTIATAEKFLPAGLCPLIKSTFGYHAEKSNPFLEMADLVVAETTCDGKKKMFELMSETRPMHVMQLPQQSDTPQAKAAWRQECRRLKRTLEEKFEKTISNDCLKSAVSQMNHERKLRRELAFLMARKKPSFTGRELLGLNNSIIACTPWAIARYKNALKKYSACGGCDELASRVRVMLTGVPTVHGAERVVEHIESCGGLVVVQENCTGLKPILEDVKLDAGDVMDAIADKYIALPCSVMSPNNARMELLGKLAEQFSPDCVIDLSWQGCLTYDVESHYARRFADGASLPFLKIQTDYSPSDSARLAVRIEALMESAKRRKK